MTETSLKESVPGEVLGLLSEKYPSGYCEWLYKYHPDAYTEISQLAERGNVNFMSSGGVKKFKMILTDYWICHKKPSRSLNKE